MSLGFAADILLPTKIALSVQAYCFEAESAAGRIGIFPQHIDYVGALVPGIAKIRLQESPEQIYCYLGPGFLSFLQGRLTVVVETMERPESIDHERALQAEQRAIERLAAKDIHARMDIVRANQALARARARKKLAHMYSTAQKKEL